MRWLRRLAFVLCWVLGVTPPKQRTTFSPVPVSVKVAVK